MSKVKIWVHAVWPTKERNPFLNPELKKVVVEHIKENATKKNIHIEELDGSFDHLHCLFQLRSDVSLADTIKWIKGESSFWVNKNKKSNVYFEWAKEYYAASVDENSLERVKTYIQNQEERHRLNKPDFEEWA